MLLPGIALNFGSPRSKIRVKVGQIEVTAIAATEINSRDVVVAYIADSNTYLVWGNSAPKSNGVIRKNISRQKPRSVKKRNKLLPIKVLAAITNLENQTIGLWLYGDRTKPTLVQEIPIVRDENENNRTSVFAASIQNTGKEQSDWELYSMFVPDNRVHMAIPSDLANAVGSEIVIDENEDYEQRAIFYRKANRTSEIYTGDYIFELRHVGGGYAIIPATRLIDVGESLPEPDAQKSGESSTTNAIANNFNPTYFCDGRSFLVGGSDARLLPQIENPEISFDLDYLLPPIEVFLGPINTFGRGNYQQMFAANNIALTILDPVSSGIDGFARIYPDIDAQSIIPNSLSQGLPDRSYSVDFFTTNRWRYTVALPYFGKSVVSRFRSSLRGGETTPPGSFTVTLVESVNYETIETRMSATRPEKIGLFKLLLSNVNNDDPIFTPLPDFDYVDIEYNQYSISANSFDLKKINVSGITRSLESTRVNIDTHYTFRGVEIPFVCKHIKTEIDNENGEYYFNSVPTIKINRDRSFIVEKFTESTTDSSPLVRNWIFTLHIRDQHNDWQGIPIVPSEDLTINNLRSISAQRWSLVGSVLYSVTLSDLDATINAKRQISVNKHQISLEEDTLGVVTKTSSDHTVFPLKKNGLVEILSASFFPT